MCRDRWTHSDLGIVPLRNRLAMEAEADPGILRICEIVCRSADDFCRWGGGGVCNVASGKISRMNLFWGIAWRLVHRWDLERFALNFGYEGDKIRVIESQPLKEA